jgi:hypothetical protein
VFFSQLVAVFAVQASTLQAVKLSVIESRAEICILGLGTGTAGVGIGVSCLKCITKPPIFEKNECTVLHDTPSLFERAPSFLVVDKALLNSATAFSKGSSGASNVNAIKPDLRGDVSKSRLLVVRDPKSRHIWVLYRPGSEEYSYKTRPENIKGSEGVGLRHTVHHCLGKRAVGVAPGHAF